MDPEKQPLLGSLRPEMSQRYRTLTSQEVFENYQQGTWSRARTFLVITFWSLIVLSLCIVINILSTAPKCNSIDTGVGSIPIMAPVHLNLAPLMYSTMNSADTVNQID